MHEPDFGITAPQFGRQPFFTAIASISARPANAKKSTV